MAILVSPGDKLPLSAVLEDGAEDKFLTAHVLKYDGGEVSGSPFSLIHVGLGLYRNLGFTTMALDKRYFAVYRVFNDAGHVDESTEYDLRTEEVFDIISSSVAGGGNIIEGEIVSEILTGVIEDTMLTGIIEQDEVL